MKIQLARYRDKPRVDCTKYRQEGFEETDEGGIVDISTYGAWCYHAWVEDGEFAEPRWDRLDNSNCGTTGIYRYRPDAHHTERAKKSIKVPEFVERMVDALNLYDEGGEESPVRLFLLDLKLTFMQIYALGLGDFTGIYFKEYESTPTQLF